jgi:hypothetical protein
VREQREPTPEEQALIDQEIEKARANLFRPE